jgi:hypothetical protein
MHVLTPASHARATSQYKGPIKVYAVGEYDDGSYVLKMSYGVGAQKMTSALADALKPRCSDATLIEEFEECLLKGLPNGAPKGTQLAFSTGGGKLGVVRRIPPLKILASAYGSSLLLTQPPSCTLPRCCAFA